MRFFTLIQPQQTKYALDHEGWVVGVAALRGYFLSIDDDNGTELQ